MSPSYSIIDIIFTVILELEVHALGEDLIPGENCQFTNGREFSI